jgi:hypothetical protein
MVPSPARCCLIRCTLGTNPENLSRFSVSSLRARSSENPRARWARLRSSLLGPRERAGSPAILGSLVSNMASAAAPGQVAGPAGSLADTRPGPRGCSDHVRATSLRVMGSPIIGVPPAVPPAGPRFPVSGPRFPVPAESGNGGFPDSRFRPGESGIGDSPPPFPGQIGNRGSGYWGLPGLVVILHRPVLGSLRRKAGGA